jgi:hypothetical protein
MLPDLKIKRVLVVREHHGSDKVHFTLDGPSPTPEMQQQDPVNDYSPHLTVIVRRGYAEEWLKLMGFDLSSVKILDLT